MSRPPLSTPLRILGAASVAILLLAIGVVAGAAWQNSRVDDARTPSVVDIGFAQDMSTHHDQAILMANTVAELPGVSPEIIGFARRLVAAQTAETSTMRGLLSWFGEPMTSPEPMSWMSMPDGPESHGGAHHHGSSSAASARPDQPPMPGMASVGELARLAESNGADAEILFLQLMIRHHHGGLAMAQAAHNDERADSSTKDLALTMISEQGDEIGQMTLFLRARGAAPLPT